MVETGIEGLKVVDLAVHGDSRGWFKENWQRAKMTALASPTSGRPEQRLLQRQPRRHPRHPRGALGQVHLRGPRLGLRRMGRPARGQRHLRQGLHDRAGPPPRPSTSARRGQLLPGPGGRHRLHLPGGRPLVAGAQEDLHLREPRRPRARHRVADPAGGVRTQRGRPAPPDAQDAKPMAPRRTMVTGCNGQLGHAVRALAEERGVAKDFDFCDIDTSTCPTRTPTQNTTGRSTAP